MREYLRSFLQYLELNRNASLHTVRAYDSDLSQFLDSLARTRQRKLSELSPTDIDHLTIREFLRELYQKGNSRASAARKLTAIRTFCRYLRREGLIEEDPAALVGTPKREEKLPAHLEINEMAK